jgi:hypothetical protein
VSALARSMQTSAGMLRTRPDAFIRSMVTAATVGPFWTALRDMKQARVHSARQIAPTLEPVAMIPATPMLPPVAAQKAA